MTAVSTHLGHAAIDQIRLQGEVKEAGRFLGAAGFTELPGLRPDARVAFRTHGVYNDLVLLFTDGHVEAIRQHAEGPLWLPGQDSPGGGCVWSRSGGPLEVVHELLNLG